MEVSMQQDFMATRDDSRRMAEEHHAYTLQLERLLINPYLTEEEKLEAARLKKLKLRLKDRMEALARGSGTPLSAA